MQIVKIKDHADFVSDLTIWCAINDWNPAFEIEIIIIPLSSIPEAWMESRSLPESHYQSRLSYKLAMSGLW